MLSESTLCLSGLPQTRSAGLIYSPAAVPVAFSDRPSLGKGLRLPPRFSGSPER